MRMKLIKFKRYRDYVNAQRQTAEEHQGGPYFNVHEINRVCDWIRGHERRLGRVPRRIKSGVCHGARHGAECDEFKKHFTNLEMFGTDLFPNFGRTAVDVSKIESKVIKHDFSARKLEWVGNFDLIYSNSLDHARNPKSTLQVWFEQLKPDGYLVIQWAKGCRTLKGGDCFAGHLDEWIEMIHGIGEVKEVLFCWTERIRSDPLRRRAQDAIDIICQGKAE